ncbi:hypothetical protein BC834DRAFT_909058 [Gloeopeniophorella convolvens]|nr:hypothetical protein BC834DRAFT_909058 [Gloeopeniophorella convolvens]
MQTFPGHVNENLAAMIPCNQDPGLRRDLLAAIQEKINSTESHLRSLYAQFNGLVPVFLLPTELLARIFHLLRDAKDYRKTVRLPPAVTVSHVALNDSSLWSAIRDHAPQCSQKWLTEMLARSKNATLDIELLGHDPNIFRSLTCHSSRISRLSLSGLMDSLVKSGVQGLFKTEAPALEDLHMEKGYYQTRPIPTSGFRLFHQQSSRLRKVHLHNIHVPWTSFPKYTLTHLEIISESLDTAEPGLVGVLQLGTLDDLVDVLANSPYLERLTLKRCIAPVSLQPTSPAKTLIKLPQLRRLDLSGPSSSVLRIFDSIHAPVLQALALSFAATNQADVASWPTIAPYIFSHFYRTGSGTGSVSVRILRLRADNDFNGKMKVSVEGLSSLITPAVPSSPFDGPFVSLEFKGHSPDDNQAYHEVIWQEVCAALHMAELESLRVTNTTLPTEQEPPLWTRLFERCTNVANASNPTPSAAPQDLDEPAPALLFPKLTCLSLDTLNFDLHYGTGERVYELVYKLLECRERCGAPIRKLCISECGVDSTEIDSLKSLVPEVDWDGIEDI